MKTVKKIVAKVGTFLNALMEARAKAAIARAKHHFYHWD